MIYEILDKTGKVINRIIADEIFVQEQFPEGNYRLTRDSVDDGAVPE